MDSRRYRAKNINNLIADCLKQDMIKAIDNFPEYYVDEKGTIYHKIKNGYRKLKPWFDGRHHYLMVTLVNQYGHKKELVHRLVAKAFLPNLNNLPVVNHRNAITTDNCVDNLE